jgi:phospholipid/cholesterol/gamma-HCH transport system substrate-binding protein
VNHRIPLLATLAKLGVAVLVAALLFVIIVNGIKNPVKGPQTTYTADFTDVSGLHVNGDVRTRGVQIGKVLSIRLIQRDGDTLGEVGFSLKRPYRLVDNSVLAIKYQDLTGIRYVDLTEPAAPGRPVDHLSTASTHPSFDITELFNGMQPVLTTMSPAELNTFTRNAIALLQGDGAGLGPMLDSVQRLAEFAHDRQQVIATLVGNLTRISDAMGGRSPDLMEFFHDIGVPVAAAISVLEDFGPTSVFGPEFMAPIDRLVREIGLTSDLDIDTMLAKAFSSMPAAADALRLLPAAFGGLQTPRPAATNRGPGAPLCSHGVAGLPADVKVLLNGSEVVICNKQ